MAHLKTPPIVMFAVSWLTLCGCASTGTLIETPAVVLSSVKLESASIRRQTFLLGIDIANPNPFPLPVKSLSYQVKLDGEQFASGETDANFTIPANGDGAFALKVDLDLLRTTHQIRSLLQNGSTGAVNYDLDGRLNADIPFAPPIPFATSGVISIRR